MVRLVSAILVARTILRVPGASCRKCRILIRICQLLKSGSTRTFGARCAASSKTLHPADLSPRRAGKRQKIAARLAQSPLHELRNQALQDAHIRTLQGAI